MSRLTSVGPHGEPPGGGKLQPAPLGFADPQGEERLWVLRREPGVSQGCCPNPWRVSVTCLRQASPHPSLRPLLGQFPRLGREARAAALQGHPAWPRSFLPLTDSLFALRSRRRASGDFPLGAEGRGPPPHARTPERDQALLRWPASEGHGATGPGRCPRPGP